MQQNGRVNQVEISINGRLVRIRRRMVRRVERKVRILKCLPKIRVVD